MVDKNTIKLNIEGELTNYQQIVEYIRTGIDKALVDGVSEKTLQKVANRIQTGFEQIKLGNFEAALDTLGKIGNSLLTISESINIAAGAAKSDIDQVRKAADEAQKRVAELEKNNPKGRYRELTDSEGNRTGHFVRGKAGVNRQLVGVSSEEDWKSGRATFTGTKGESVEIQYGGKNWSVNSAVSNLVEALNKGALALNEQVQVAIKEFGYSIEKSKDNKYSATRLDLTEEQKTVVAEWTQRHNAAKEAYAAAKLAVKEAEANVESVKITAESGEFVTPNLKVVQAQERVQDLNDQYTEATVEQTKAKNKQINADEAARDAQDKLANSLKNGTEFQNKQTNAVSRAVTTFFGYQMALRQLRKLWREAIHTVTELDKQLTNQAIVTNLTREDTWKLVTTYQQLADQAGVTQTEIAAVTTEYLRQGETLTNALTLTKAATAAATVAGISASDSVKYLTTAVHGFKLEAEDALAVSDKFAALAAQAATNYEDLAIALSKVASQAELAGMSMDYTLALLTTGLDVTQEAPESIGTALKTVIARMREISDYGKTLEDNTDLNQVEDGLKAVGVELRNGIGELRSTEDVLDDLGHKWKELSANQQAAVAKALAGTRQQSRLVAILENYDRVLNNMAVSQNSLGATTAQQVKYLQGMEAAMNKLQNAYQSFIEGIVKSDFIIGIVNTIGKLIQNVQKFLNNPFGRFALVSGVISLLTRSKELVAKVNETINQTLLALGKIDQAESRITAQKQKQLQLYTKQKYLSDELAKEPRYSDPRPAGPLSNREGKANFASALTSLFQFGPGYKERLRNTWSEWNANNSPWAKISEARALRKDRNRNLAQADKDLTAVISAQDSLDVAMKNRDAQIEAVKQARKTQSEATKALKVATAEAAATEEELKAAQKKSVSIKPFMRRPANAQASERKRRAESESRQALQENRAALEAAKERNQAAQQTLANATAVSEAAKAQSTAAQAQKEAAEKTLTSAKEELKAAQAQAGGPAITKEEAKQRLKIIRSRFIDKDAREQYIADKALIDRFNDYQNKGIKDILDKVEKKQDLTEKETNLLKDYQDDLNALPDAQKRVDDLEENASTIRNQKISKTVSKAAGYAAVISGAISMVQGMVDTIKNRYTEAVNNAIDKSTEIQSKIYNNTRTMTNLQNLGDSLKKLDAQVIKTSDTMQELNDTRQQLMEELDLDANDARIYTNQQLYDKAMAKRLELENKNNELLQDLGNTLLGAANNFDWGAAGINILTKIGTGAGLGAMTGNGFVAAAGAIVGGVVGAVEELSKLIAANDAKGKVAELLKTDEGVSQMQYYFKAMYKSTIDTTTAEGERLANSIKTTYASLIDSLTGDDMNKLLEQYNWNVQALADGVGNALSDASDALTKLTSDESTYVQRTEAAAELYVKLNNESAELGAAFRKQYGTYIELGVILGDSVKYMDEFKWSMTNMNELLTQLAEDGWKPEQMARAVAKLGEAAKDGTLDSEDLASALGGMSKAAREAVSTLLNGGQSMQDLADQFTLANNTVKTIRDTQANWSSMSASDRQHFIDENASFFNIEGAREAFYNGEDITPYIEEYKKSLQETLNNATKNQIMAKQAEIYSLEQELKATDSDSEVGKELQQRLTTLKRELADLYDTYQDVEHMFDLTLAEVVEKQNQQIEKLKEMYQTEEKALVDSLNKRKEAYQKYFDSLQAADRIEDYAENRDQLLTSISRLTGGTDATSRNKMRDAQKQLRDLEKQEAQQRKEDARQAVLDNIDSQVEKIQEHFEELLENNQKLLASMDESTEVQYLNYLATMGLTDEDMKLRAQEMGDLLRGRWAAGGRQDWDVPPTSVPVTDVEPGNTQNTFNITGADGSVHQVELSSAQMQTLITQMLAQINRWTGSSYAINKKG